MKTNRHLLIAVVALIIAVASSGVIASFTDQIRRTLLSESASFIGADLVLDSSKPIAQTWIDEAQSYGLTTAKIVEFSSMVFSGQSLVLGSIKAVDASYPLKGELVLKPLNASATGNTSVRPSIKTSARLSTAPITSIRDLPARTANRAPEPDEIWISESLYYRLNLDELEKSSESTDDQARGIRLTVGDQDFRLTHIIAKEPDSAQSLFGAAPRAMLSTQTLSTLNVLGPGSRARFKLQVAGDEIDITRFSNQLEDKLGEHTTIQSVQDRDRNLGDALNRGLSFFSIASVLSIILCAIAIALSSFLYARSKVQTIALRKSFGESAKSVFIRELITLTKALAIGVIIGGAVALALNSFLVRLIAPLFSIEIAPFRLLSLLYPTLACGLIFYLFSLPSILSLVSTSPWQVLKSKEFKQRMGAILLMSLSVLFSLFYFYLGRLTWAVYLTIIVAALVAILVLGLRFLLAGLLSLFAKRAGYFPIALRNLYRQANLNAFTLSVLSLLFFSISTLVLLRTELIDSWRSQLNENTPNYFAFNIYGDDAKAITDFIEDYSLPSAPAYPMIRGRVTQIAGEDFSSRLERLKARDGHDRELNFTWSAELGADNRVVQGSWWGNRYQECSTAKSSSDCPLLVSVEKDYASDFNIKPGDELSFSIGGLTKTARVDNIRSVSWNSMNPNFYIIFNKLFVENDSANYLTSFKLPSELQAEFSDFSRSHPAISFIELDALINQIQGMITQISQGIEFILALVLIAGLLVLIVISRLSNAERVKQNAIIKSFGAENRFVLGLALSEFVIIGAISAALIVPASFITLAVVQNILFQSSYELNVLYAFGVFTSVIMLCVLAGYLSIRSTLNKSPIEVLR